MQDARSYFEVDAESETATARLPFVNVEEARDAATALGLGLVYGRSCTDGADVSAELHGGQLTVRVAAPSPDSYSDEWRNPELFVDKRAAQLASGQHEVSKRLRALGMVSREHWGTYDKASGLLAPLRPDVARGMPPTARRDRSACSVVALAHGRYLFERALQTDDQTQWCDSTTLEPVAPMPLLIGASYWITHTAERILSIDVAAVTALALEELRATIESCKQLELDVTAVDPLAFLAHELQYQGVSGARLAANYRLRMYAHHHALSLEAGLLAAANSLAAVITARAGAHAATYFGEQVQLRRANVLEVPELVFEIANTTLQRNCDGLRITRHELNGRVVWWLAGAGLQAG